MSESVVGWCLACSFRRSIGQKTFDQLVAGRYSLLAHLLEVVRAAKTSKETLATAMKLAKAIKKVGVVAGVCDGMP